MHGNTKVKFKLKALVVWVEVTLVVGPRNWGLWGKGGKEINRADLP